MNNLKSYNLIFFLLIVLLIGVLIFNLSFGSVSIPFSKIVAILFSEEEVKDSWKTIILDYRIPKSITAILVGSGLSISGLLMQTLFRNPLAGPFVLGISSGASLGVALLILGTSLFGGLGFISSSSFGIAIAASIGSLVIMSTVMIVANSVRNTMSILIIGLMFGSITSAVISILAYFSEPEQLQKFIFWGFGSLGNLSWNELSIFSSFYLLSMSLLAFILKPLNSLLIGESYAMSMGVNIRFVRNIMLLITSVLTGVITAFSGPIAFVGLAVPHIARLIFNTSNHTILLPASAILGAMLMLIADTFAQLPTSQYTLPINAITSLFGAPIVIWLLVRKKNLYL